MSDTHIEHITELSEFQAAAVRALEEACSAPEYQDLLALLAANAA